MRMAYIARPRLKNKLPKELTEAVVQTLSVKKVFLEISQNSQENACAGVSQRPEACNLIKVDTLAHVFSCEFFEISKNTFFS